MESLYLLSVNAWVSALQAIMPGCQHFRLLCLGVSTSGYYAWRKRQANTAQKYNDLKAVYWQHHARLGVPSLVHDMHDLGYSMSERTVVSGNVKMTPQQHLKIDPLG